MSDTNKFQWSRQVDKDIYVVRSDDFDELEDGIGKVEKRLQIENFDKEIVQPRKEQKVESKTEEKSDTQICPIHKVEMTGREGKYGYFYSHKTDAGTWCNGRHKEY